MDVDQIERLRRPGFTLARRGYDRREVDNLLGSLIDWLESDAPGEIGDLAVKRKLELVGRSTNRSAAPESVQLKTAPADGDPTEPWPFSRFAPDGFTEGKRLASDSDRARFREGLIRLLDKSARFSHKGKVWKVEDLDLIP